MQKFFYIVILIISSSAFFTQEDEQLEVKGNVLFKDRVTSLNPPVPIINVPQTVSIITDEDILERGYRACLLYTSPSPRDGLLSRMPSSA